MRALIRLAISYVDITRHGTKANHFIGSSCAKKMTNSWERSPRESLITNGNWVMFWRALTGGRGYMTETVKGVVDWALKQQEIYRVWWVCDGDNIGSARVMEKVVMQREGLCAVGRSIRLSVPSREIPTATRSQSNSYK